MKRRATTSHRSPGRMLHPLSAVPVVSPGVEVKTAPNGELHLRRRAKPSSLIEDRVFRVLRLRPASLINLDERGAFFWRQIDGVRSLAQIEHIIRGEWGTDTTATRAAMLQYTRELMKRKLIGLNIDTGTPNRNGAESS